MGLRRNYYTEDQPATATGQESAPLLRLEKLSKHFPLRGGLLRRQRGAVKAVDQLSLTVRAGETVALVGGTRSGKSTLGRTIVQLEKLTDGRLYWQDQDISTVGKAARRKLRRELQMLFQDPYAALSPHMRVREIIAEPLGIHQLPADEAQIAALLAAVGLNSYFADRFPFEFAGGNRQRINLARVLAAGPQLIILDEPLAVLDQAVRPQLIALLQQLQAERGVSYLWLTRDLPTALAVADRIGIIYMGRLVEIGTAAELAERPLHPYTQYLRSTIPLADPAKEAARREITLPGQPPDPKNPPAGCQFHPRCAYATDECRRETPLLRVPGQLRTAQEAACHHAEQFIE